MRLLVLGIPVTTVARTLVDLAASLEVGALARACHEAGVQYGTNPSQVEEVLIRRPHSPGSGRLRAVLRGDVHVTLSALERRFLRILRAERLPLPETNRVAGGRRVDFRWPELRLTVELYRYHGTPSRVGAGPPARARSSGARRRVPPLHLWRRLRGAASHARRAPRHSPTSCLAGLRDQ